MADSNRPRGECQHGQLARQCELCEKDATIAEQAATIARLEGERAAQQRTLFDVYRVLTADAEGTGASYLQAAEWLRNRAEHAEAERDALTARVRRLQARVDALFSAASLGRAALGRHDRWCGHSRNAPGDAIIHQAERALTEALDPSRCLDCGTLDYSGGRAHYEDGIRCMACATVAALQEEHPTSAVAVQAPVLSVVEVSHARPHAGSGVKTTQTLDHILTDADAARYVGLTAATLRASRLARPRCDGPPYIRMGRAVRYRLADLDAWLDDRRVVPRAMRETTA